MNSKLKRTTGKNKQIAQYETCSFQRTQLQNGVLVVTENIPHFRSVSIGIWVQVGSRYEKPAENGISHFVEHMLFKGTPNRNAFEIAQAIEKVGGVLNAFTGKELTCYYAHVLDEDLPLATGILTDILTESLFVQQEFDKEKQIILEEIHDANEVSEEIVHEYFYQDLFGCHPLALPILGTTDSVSALNRDGAMQYMNNNYSTDRIVIAAAGNVNHEQLCFQLEAKFGKLQDSSHNKIESAPFQPAKLKKYYHENAQLSHICMGSRAFSFSDHRKYAIFILNALLGSGMSSRLFQTVREKYGLCYNIYSYLEFYRDTGVFCIYSGTEHSKLDFAIELIENELEQLRMKKITRDELENTKSQLKGNLMLGLEDSSSRMNRIAKMEIYLKNYYTLDDVIAGIEKVQLEEVDDVAQTLLKPDGFVRSILSSKP
jgi:predicted Zn-dependent peptidase